MEVDVARKRISLSMKGNASGGQRPSGGGGQRQAGGKPASSGKPAAGGKPAPKEESADSFQAKLMELKKKFK
jgi:hypothetical protein